MAEVFEVSPQGGTATGWKDFTDLENQRSYRAKMTTLEKVEADVCKLSPQEQEQLREWLENLLEDRLELTDEFKAEIEAGKKEIAEGRVRIRKP